MNKETFFKHYPVRKKDSNKFDNGRVLFVSGSYGMAGAAILNIIGARSAGVSYIRSLLPENIYPIAASSQITAVYHPDDLKDDGYLNSLNLAEKVDAVGIGSGLDRHPYARKYLCDILSNYAVPVVVDAFGLRLLSENEELYSLNSRMILTPHMGEFSHLVHMSLDEINKDKENIASNFAKKHKVILVLKGPETLIFNCDGKLTRNNSGNEALARAGSGDVLTGMITGLCALYDDPYMASVDAVWLHGHLCDLAVKNHAKETFDLCCYPQYADSFFFER